MNREAYFQLVSQKTPSMIYRGYCSGARRIYVRNVDFLGHRCPKARASRKTKGPRSTSEARRSLSRSLQGLVAPPSSRNSSPLRASSVGSHTSTEAVSSLSLDDGLQSYSSGPFSFAFLKDVIFLLHMHIIGH